MPWKGYSASSWQPPLLSSSKFLLCYGFCALYINRHGDISRFIIIGFVGKAFRVALQEEYLLHFNDDLLRFVMLMTTA